jgi:hypothetical protein
VLQEELYKKELLNEAGATGYNDDYNDCYVEQINAHPQKEDGIQSIESNSDKGNYYNSNLIKIIPTSDNTYEMLSNLKEVELTRGYLKTQKPIT